jgi:uncharacterized membrane protein YozB (DUF420 family)
MSGFLGTAASSLADANLLLQVVIYILLVGGVISAKKNNFSRHGLLMGIAVLLGFASLILVMGPSLIRSFKPIIEIEYGFGSIIILVHAIVGAIALVMGVAAILSLRPCGKVRGKRRFGNVKKFMDAMFGVWTLSFILGVTIYAIFYVLK